MNLISLPAVPSIVVAGRVFTDLTNLKILSGRYNAASVPNCTPTLHKNPPSTTGYAVPVGKSFNILAIQTRLFVTTAITDPKIYLGYADNDVGSSGSASAFTNFVNLAGSKQSCLAGGANTTQEAAFSEDLFNLFVPTGKYIAVEAVGAGIGFFRIFGYEV